MLDKLCVCGHAMEDRGAQTLEMNGSSLGSNIWTDHVEVDFYVCPWCGRMAFFEPEEMRLERFTELHRGKTDEELREIVNRRSMKVLQDLTADYPDEKLISLIREVIAA